MKILNVILQILTLPLHLLTPPAFAGDATVIINEVAWMGTESSYHDEWIELYNPSSSDVDLTGWKLEAEDGTPTISLSGTLGQEEYLLLERTDDTTVSDIPAHLIYTGSLSNSGEHLRLKDAGGETVDELDCSSGWLAGSNSSKSTLERVDPEGAASDPANWATHNGSTSTGLDADSNPLNGTPLAQNSVYLTGWPVTAIATARELEEGTEVLIAGCVTAPKNLLGKDIFYLQDQTAGIRTKSTEDLPQNYRQKVLRVQGEIQKAWDEIYLKASQLEITNTDCEKIHSKRIDTRDVGEKYEGLLVDLEGKVVETSGDTFYINDGTDKAKIYLREETGIEKPTTRTGYSTKIKGVVSQWGQTDEGKDNYRVMPYEQNQVDIAPPEEEVLGATTQDGDILPTAATTNIYAEEILGAHAQLPITGLNPSWMLGVAGLCLGVAGRLVCRTKKEILSFLVGAGGTAPTFALRSR